VTESAS